MSTTRRARSRTQLPSLSARSRALPTRAVLAGVAVLLWSGGGVLAGDGSGSDNPMLLRGTLSAGCSDPVLCEPGNGPIMRPATATPIAADIPGNCETLWAAGLKSKNCGAAVPKVRAAGQTVKPVRLVDPVSTGSVRQNFVQPVLPALNDDAIKGDWSVAMRGATIVDGRGQRYEAILLPKGSLTFQGSRGDLRLSAGTELSYDSTGLLGVGNGTLAADADHALTRDLGLRTGASLSFGNETVNSVTSPGNVVQGPLIINGGFNVALDRKLGRSTVAISAQLGRQYVGNTVLAGGGTADNAYRQWTSFGFGVHGGFAVTPIVSFIVDGKADRTVFDAASPTLGAAETNWTYTGTAGLEGNWRNGTSASLYAGYTLATYDAKTLSTGAGYVVGGSLGYKFPRGAVVTASLDTAIAPTDTVAGATTRIAYTASLAAHYIINEWLTARGQVGADWAIYPGSSYTEQSLSVNAGFDYALGKHVDFNADYTFGATWTPSNSGQSHRIEAGITVRR